jgi:hypothetical protein
MGWATFWVIFQTKNLVTLGAEKTGEAISLDQFVAASCPN